VSWFRGLLPEFAYFCPSSDLRRKLTLAVAFSALGLVAGASGVALLVAGDDSDPRSAFALASPPPPSAETAIATPAAEMPAAESPTAEAVAAQKVAKVEAAKVEAAKVEAAKVEAAKVEAAKVEALPTRQPQVRAVTAPPATREAPIGHSSEPAEAAARSATFVANAPPLEEGTVTPTDATAPAPTAETPPLPTPAATTRKTARHQGRRGAPYQQFSLWPFGGGGRQRGGFRLFW
jgi:protein Tex